MVGLTATCEGLHGLSLRSPKAGMVYCFKLIEVSAETVVLPVTCAEARVPHLLISCDQLLAGDADV